MADESSQPETKGESEDKVSRVRGITDAQFNGIGKRTLEAWKSYWSDPEKYGKDGHDEARAKKDLDLINSEIEARTKDETDRKAQREADAKAKADKKAAGAESEEKAGATKS